MSERSRLVGNSANSCRPRVPKTMLDFGTSGTLYSLVGLKRLEIGRLEECYWLQKLGRSDRTIEALPMFVPLRVSQPQEKFPSCSLEIQITCFRPFHSKVTVTASDWLPKLLFRCQLERWWMRSSATDKK